METREKKALTVGCKGSLSFIESVAACVFTIFCLYFLLTAPEPTPGINAQSDFYWWLKIILLCPIMGSIVAFKHGMGCLKENPKNIFAIAGTIISFILCLFFIVVVVITL